MSKLHNHHLFHCSAELPNCSTSSLTINIRLHTKKSLVPCTINKKQFQTVQSSCILFSLNGFIEHKHIKLGYGLITNPLGFT